MTTQLPLLVPRGAGEVPYRGAPPHVMEDTSKDASLDLKPSVGALRAEVLAYMTRQGPHGATCDEAEAALDLRHQTVGPRIRELVLSGQVRDSGRRRATRSGRSAIVWVVA